MEFRTLGPLEVLDDAGRPVAPGGGRQRALLLRLLLDHGRVVPVDRLVDDLWAERPPVTARGTLQAHVSRLRRALGTGRLVHRADGYVLVAEPEELDTARFERLVAEATAALENGDAPRATETAARALGLWRGPALADVADQPWAQLDAARLEDARLAALELRIEADLALGRHARLAGELEALVARHPLREQLRGQLMLALYRCGRHVEALETYTAARSALADELGLEPGEDLQRLQRAILKHDPELAAPAQPRTQLPPEAPPPARPPADSPPERKLVTVLFADLAGSTELAAAEDPERTRLLLERFYDLCAAEIARAGGTVEKFVGDAVMAAFGAPTAHEDHAERALHAALALRRRVEELDGPSVRIGVNTGEVVVGAARHGSSFVSGEAVNAAARLEQAAAPGEILVGERTAAAVAGAFVLEGPSTVGAKGVPGGVACHRLVRAVGRERPRGVRGGPSPFVGRERELARLQDAFGAAERAGAPRLVSVAGEAGIGKSRLVAELWEWLERAQPGALRRTGRCLAYGHGITFWPLAEVLRAHFGLEDGAPAEGVLERLEPRQLLGLTLGLDVAGGLHPTLARDRHEDAWVEFIGELAADSPVVLLVEDLHWAEEPLLRLLERLLADTPGPLLLVTTARPELVDRSPTWGRGRVAGEWIWLEPLADDQATRLARELLGGDEPEAVRAVLNAAEGNPFFIEELVSGFLEAGGPPARSIPDSVHAVLATRIDGLAPDDKTALQAAAVIGRTFTPEAVHALVPDAEPDFHALAQRDFLRRLPELSPGAGRELAFKHALTREVAYGTLTKRDRARLHAGFADWLERDGGGRDELASLLAHHLSEAVRPEDADLAWAGNEERASALRVRAVGWLRRAAELALRRWEIDDALALLDRALALEGDPQRRVALLRAAADAQMARYDAEGFRRACEAALAEGPAPAEAAAIYADLALNGLARPYLWREPPPDEIARAWLAHARESAAPGSAAAALARAAEAIAAPADGATAVGEALDIAGVLGDALVASYAREAELLVATAAGRFADAAEAAAELLALAPQVTDPQRRSVLLWIAAVTFLRAGQIGDAPRLVAAVEAMAKRLTAHDRVHAFALRTALATVDADSAALAALARGAESAARANADFPCQFNWRSLLVCALGLAGAGEEREARRLEEAALGGSTIGGPASREPALIRLALLRGDLDAATRLVDELPRDDAFSVDNDAARLDALAALGDRERVQAEAEPLLEQPSYARPFALRALGAVHGERALVERAAAEFAAMGLPRRAAETRDRAARTR